MRGRGRALDMAVLSKSEETTFAIWLRDNYNNWVKLNDVRESGVLPNVMPVGGADDTLLSGSIANVANKLWVNGYADVGTLTLAINSKTFLFSVIPDSVDLSTTAAYVFQFYIDANNLLNVRFSTTANQLIAEYIGQAVSETVTVSNVIQNKILYGHVMIPAATNDMLLYLNGLLQGAVTLANAVIGTDIDNTNTAIGASTTTGTNPLNGYVGEVQVNDDEETYRTIRYQALYALGYNNPLDFHNAYTILFDGSATKVSYGSPATLDNIWDNGASILLFTTAYAAGGSNIGMFFHKRLAAVGWEFNLVNPSGTTIGYRLFIRHSTVNGNFETTTRPIEYFEQSMVGVTYDGSTPATNEPVFYHNGSALTTNAITFPTALTDDAALNLEQGGQAVDYFYDGEMPLAIIVNRVVTSDEVSEFYNGGVPKDPASLSFAADIIMTSLGGDFIDGTNIDNINSAGSGTIYDASGNGNNGTTVSMTTANLIETRPVDYVQYLANINSVTTWELAYYGYGSKLRVYGDSATIGTNTTRNGNDYLGNARIAFDKTANGYADMYNGGSGQFTGTIPPTMTMYFRISFVNPADGGKDAICHIEVDANEYYSLFKETTNILTFVHRANATSVSLTYDISTSLNFHDITVTTTPTAIAMYVDGVLVDSDTVAQAPTGTIALAVLGADSLTPTDEMDGDMIHAWFDTNTALTAAQISAIHSYLGR